MSEIVELLTKSAKVERQAYHDYIKSFASSGISSLVSGGVGFEKAAEVMKTACEQNPKIVQLGNNLNILEKTSEYISELETKVENLEKIANDLGHKVEIQESTPLSKLAAAGFTQEEIEHMSSLPENLIEKVASNNNSPWEMGAGVGLAREKTDPLLEFMLS